MAATRRPRPWRYSAWDGSQAGFELDADDVLASVSDDLLYHGDLDAALRRVLQEGFTTPAGERVAGLRELLDRLRARREELLGRSDLADLTEDVRRRLEAALDAERAELDRQVAAAPSDPEAARRAAEGHARLDLLPPDLAGQVGALMNYEFASAAAAEMFEQLVAELRRDLAQLQLDRAAGALAAAGPEERAHLRAGIDALNTMLEQRARGEAIDPSFEQFMSEFGDLFPGASSLDELLQQLAERMAAASALLASMTPEQRAELAALAEELLSDLDLAWQLDRLGGNLRAALPTLGWDQGRGLSGGGDPLGLAEAGELFVELAELDRLGQLLRGATQPGELAEVDAEQAARLLGPDAAAELERLASLTRRLEEQGLVARREGRLQMTPRGLRRLGSKALDELFSRLRKEQLGEHPVHAVGLGHDRDTTTKAYEYGDPLHLDIQRTLRNALLRAASEDAAPGLAAAERPTGRRSRLPIRLDPGDFEIEQSEHLSTASTVLAVDLSLSMPMRDNFLAAKKVAMALQALIASRYPRDYLGLIGFSATAREIRPAELPEVSWDFAYGTNLQHTLALARGAMLAGKPGAKQVIVITDGEPTAHVLAGGEVFFDYPPAPETLEATLSEVARCTRAEIAINTFVLDATGALRAFVEQMTRMNRGRAFFTTPDELGGYVLVDFVEQRAARTRRLPGGG